MPPFRSLARAAVAFTMLSLLTTQPAWAWGREGHMMINRLAIQYLPGDVPQFLRDAHAIDLVEYMGPEPDRWRSRAEPELSAAQAPDHFLDEEYADLVGTPCTVGSPGCSSTGTMLPRQRYEFLRDLEAAQAEHPDLPLAPDKVGMQPWQVEEVWERLKSDMRDYRQLAATHGDVAPVESIILFDAGWLGHYVADGSQPLHTTRDYNGWTEKQNPHGYTTEHHIHAQFESVYVAANIRIGEVAPLVAATKPRMIEDEWTQYLDYIHHTNSLVEETYKLDRSGGFTGAGTPDARSFTDKRLAAGAIELRNLIYSAWLHSAEPVPEYHGF